MPTLDSTDHPTIQNAVGSNFTIHTSSVARLYKSNPPGKWGFSGLVGAVTVVTNKQNASHYIKLVSLTDNRVVFSQEMYSGFIYTSAAAFFHVFETDGWVAGFSFADAGEAAVFLEKVSFCKTMIGLPTPKGGKKGKKGSKKASKKASKGKKTKKKGGWFSKKDKKKGGKKGAGSFSLSGPQNFRHVSHAGWDSGKGVFEIRNLPAEWREWFNQAGIKDEELENPEIAGEIHKILLEGEGGGPPAASAPPPAPPGPAAPAPPPPPPAPGAPPPPGSPGPPGGAPPKGAGAPPPPPTSNSGGGGGFLAGIAGGAATLKAVSDAPPRPPVQQSGGDDIVSRLQNRICQLRGAMDSDEEESSGSWGSDSD